MIYNIQVLRGLAAMMVVLQHAIDQMASRGGRAFPFDMNIGQAGVDIFFVISGFMMLYVTHRQRRTPIAFWRDRIIRIVPIYWFYTLLLTAIVLTLPGHMKTAQFDQIHVMKSLLFVPAFHPKIDHRIWPLLVQGWTLNYEMFFYLIFGALLVVRAGKLRLGVLGALLAALVVLGALFSPDSAAGRIYTNPLLLEFFAGAFVAQLYLDGHLARAVIGQFCLITGVTLLVISVVFPGWLGSRAMTWGLPASLIVIAAISLEQRHSQPKLLALVGDCSYSIYLSHTFTLAGIGLIWSQLKNSTLAVDLVILITACVLTVIIGITSFRILEQPTTYWLRRKMNVDIHIPLR